MRILNLLYSQVTDNVEFYQSPEMLENSKG